MSLVHLKTVSFFLLNLFVVSSCSSILTEAAIATEILEQAAARTQIASVVPSETKPTWSWPNTVANGFALVRSNGNRASPGLWTAR